MKLKTNQQERKRRKKEPKPRSLKRLDEISARKAERYSQIGREFEKQVENYLAELQVAGQISSFTRHEPHTMSDRNGKDFTIRQNGDEVSFGVTISHKQWQKARIQHPEVTTFHFPLGTKPETVKKRVLELFEHRQN